MTLLAALVAQLLHIALMLAAAPALTGLMDWLDARLAGRAGPPLRQPWHELVRLSRKTAVLPESASAVLSLSPSISLGATLSVAVLVPSFTLGMALAPLADGLVVVGLLAVASVAAQLGALDTGAARSGLAAQGATAQAAMIEPALLLFMLSLALMGGSLNLDLIAAQQQEGMLLPAAASALALTALLALVFADTSMPAELDQDLSGLALALGRFAVWLRLVVWADLIGTLFLPIGMARSDAGLLAWGVGLLCWAARLIVFALCLCTVRTVVGRVAQRNLPNLVGIAALLALLAIVMVLASGGTA